MFGTSNRLVGAIAAAVLTMSVSGCAAKKDFTIEEFARVNRGMTESAVNGILGSPTETISAGDVKYAFYVVGEKYYSVGFKDGKVTDSMPHANKDHYTMTKTLMEGLSKASK